MRFIHISDTHVGPDKNSEIFGSNPYQRLQSLIDHLNTIPLDYDFVVHTGDIVESGSESSYQVALSLFNKIAKPVYFIPGNHDNADLVEKHLYLKPVKYINEKSDKSYIIEKDLLQFLFLDAPVPGANEANGRICKSTLKVIKAYILKPKKRSHVFIHYPPIEFDSRWLNSKMLLINGAELHELLRIPGSNVEAVYFGHVHKGLQVIKDGLIYLSAGSTFCQFNAWPEWEEPEFSPKEPTYYNIVTITKEQLIIKNHAVPHL